MSDGDGKADARAEAAQWYDWGREIDQVEAAVTTRFAAQLED